MIEIEIDDEDLLKWARYMNEARAQTPRSVASAMNAFGNNVKAGMIEYLAASTGLDPEQVNSVTTVDEASPANLEWRMDASRALLTDADEWRRPWLERRSDSEFEQQILLNIETQPDCCEICEEVSNNGPYTAAEIREMAAKWKDFTPTGHSWLSALTRTPVTNLIHPNCHCSTSQWQAANRQMPVLMGGEAHLWTPEQLGRALAKQVMDELEGDIRVILNRG